MAVCLAVDGKLPDGEPEAWYSVSHVQLRLQSTYPWCVTHTARESNRSWW